MKSAKKLIFLALATMSICGLLLAGCHTMQGVGQDVQSGGQAITKAACKDKTCKNNNHK